MIARLLEKSWAADTPVQARERTVQHYTRIDGIRSLQTQISKRNFDQTEMHAHMILRQHSSGKDINSIETEYVHVTILKTFLYYTEHRSDDFVQLYDSMLFTIHEATAKTVLLHQLSRVIVFVS